MKTVTRTYLLGALVVVGVLAVAGAVGWASPAAAQADPLSVVEQATVAVNAGDVEGFVDLFADDGVFVVVPCLAVFGPGGCVGKDAIRAVSSVFILDAFEWMWTQELQVSGNIVNAGPAVARFGALAALGIDRVLFNANTWEVVDGKIVRAVLETDLSDPDSVTWRDAVFAQVAAMQLPDTGSGGLAATNGDGLPAWPFATGAAVLALLLLSVWRLAARRSAA